MPRGASPKREREYRELETKFKKEGRYKGRQKEVAARIVNKQRRKAGETKAQRKSSSKAKTRTKTTRRRSTRTTSRSRPRSRSQSRSSRSR